MNQEIEFRNARPGDGKLVLSFITALADYEHMLEDVTATAESLEKQLFVLNSCEVIFVLFNGKEVGYALFFHNFSTFMSKRGLFLEDLFVLPEYRRQGIGKALLTQLARIAVERDCARFEWNCLDWNEPSIEVYKSLGALPLDEWITFRLTGEDLLKLAETS